MWARAALIQIKKSGQKTVPGQCAAAHRDGRFATEQTGWLLRKPWWGGSMSVMVNVHAAHPGYVVDGAGLRLLLRMVLGHGAARALVQDRAVRRPPQGGFCCPHTSHREDRPCRSTDG